jgi:hypothetical protein
MKFFSKTVEQRKKSKVASSLKRSALVMEVKSHFLRR